MRALARAFLAMRAVRLFPELVRFCELGHFPQFRLIREIDTSSKNDPYACLALASCLSAL